MSTTNATPPSGSAASGHTSATQQGNGQATRSTSGRVDLFASLLGLLSATSDLPLDADGLLAGLASSDDPATTLLDPQDPTEDTGNPLAALLGWPGAPVLSTDPAAGADEALLAGTPSAKSPAGQAATTGTSAGAGAGAGTTLAAAAAEGPADGISLQGMRLLDQPELADPELLAGLQRGEAPSTAARHPGRTDAAAFASRPANWRSTTALASPTSATATLNSTTALQQGSASQVRLPPEAVAGAVRSTVTLNERFSTALAAEPSIDSPLGAPPSLGGGQTGSDQAPPGGSGLGHAGALGTTDRSESDTEFTLQTEPMAEEAPPEEAALNPHSLRHASLRVGEGSEGGSIDIRLALQGEQLNVDFRTDNADTRASLQQHAGGSLADLLQRNGIQLGDVSVGAQTQDQPGQPGQPPASRPHNASGRPGTQASEAPAAPVAPGRRNDGSRALDLFV